MRILWIKAGGVVPADTGGKIRSFQMLRELAKRHEVTLFTFYPEHPGDQHPALRGFTEVIPVPTPLPKTRTAGDYWSYAQRLFSSAPYSMEKFYTERVRREIAAVQARNGYDLLVCDFLTPAGLIEWRRPVAKVLFTHNVEAQIWERQSRVTGHPLLKLAYWREARALARAEERYLQLADHVLTVSENDRAYFRRYVLPEKITAIPTGVDVEYFHPGTEPEDAQSIVFTGSMDWMPNDDGVLYFVREILPLIHQEVPGATLWVVGRRPTRQVQALAGDRIRVTGTVDDIRPHVQRARAYVVPLRSGSGTRIKIFEAMAMGKAVVSTTLGAEGLPVTHERNLVLADTPQQFARSVVELLRDPARARHLGGNARQLVEERFGWKAVVDELEPVFEAVRARKPVRQSRPARAGSSS